MVSVGSGVTVGVGITVGVGVTTGVGMGVTLPPPALVAVTVLLILPASNVYVDPDVSLFEAYRINDAA